MLTVIMAGGEGKRLRPLTCLKPKPLVEMLGEPIMGYALKLCARHGFHQIAATVRYKMEAIEARYGSRLRYVEEKGAPLGTAGSVKLAAKNERERVLVLSGDGLTDCDLSEALRFHIQSGALATMVLSRCAVPTAFGVVVTGREGRVERFIEKPSWENVCGELVNTGLYILERRALDFIPEGAPFDFGGQLFPLLVQKGEDVRGYETKDYWCDVGDPASYLRAQRDLLSGKMTLYQGARGQLIEESARVSPSARIEGACYVGRNAVIGERALLRDACMLEGARADEDVQIIGGIVCENARLTQGARMGNESVLGPNAYLCKDAALKAGVCVYAGRRVGAGVRLSENAVYEDAERFKTVPGGLALPSPARGAALGQALSARSCAVMRGQNGAALYHALIAGLLSAGARVYPMNSGAAPLLAGAVGKLKPDFGLYAQADRVLLLDGDGLPLCPQRLEKLSRAAASGDYPPPDASLGALLRAPKSDHLYLRALFESAPQAPCRAPVAVACGDAPLKSLARRALLRAGYEVRDHSSGCINIELSASGLDVTIREGAIIPSDTEKELLLCAAFRRGGMTALYEHPGLPAAAAKILPVRPPDGSEECFSQARVRFDGLSRALWILPYITEKSLQERLLELPRAALCRREAPCPPGMRARAMGMLTGLQLPRDFGPGLRLFPPGAHLTLSPDAEKNAVHVSCEAADMETAKELCDFYSLAVRKAAKRR